MGRYPRTVEEFAQNMREVVVMCSDCKRRRTVPPDVLSAMFGESFDLYDGYAALESELRCEECGKKHRLIPRIKSGGRLRSATPDRVRGRF